MAIGGATGFFVGTDTGEIENRYSVPLVTESDTRLATAKTSHMKCVSLILYNSLPPYPKFPHQRRGYS